MLKTKYNYILLWRQSDWGYYMRRNETFAWMLARREKTNMVVHVELISAKGLLKLFLNYVAKPTMRKAIILQIKKLFKNSPIKQADKIYVKSIFTLTVRSETRLKSLSERMIIRQIRPLDGNIKINGDNHAKILVVYPPSLLADLGIKLIDHDLLVADLIDDVVARANSENMRLEFLTSYQKVLPKCDWITATGQSLKSYEDIAGQNIESLPNGVEVDAYKNDQAPRRGIKDAPQIGYVGSINKAMDFELLQFCLQKLPDLQFIFAGFFDQSGKQNLKKCRRYPNFKYIGELHFAKVPEFLLSCDVLISIKEAGALVKGNDSMKLYQYLATGKPVVTTSMPPADRFRDLVWIADDGQSFVSCLREAVKNVDDEYDSAKRISAARKHSWTSKIEYFEQRIEKKLIEQAAIKNDH